MKCPKEEINDLKKMLRKISEIYIKAENGNLLSDSHNILNRCKNYFCQLLM
jgi:hypothetical protein